MALERYCVDNGQYPKMIWGGDKAGWSSEKGVGCRAMWANEPFDGTNETTARPPLDPLIEYGYLASYPDNPFLNKREGLRTIIQWTGTLNAQLGDGDPRFGYDGQKMGNIIEDPRYLWNKTGELSRVANTLPRNQTNSMVSNYSPANPFYSHGGMLEWCRIEDEDSEKRNNDYQTHSSTINTHWPGEFFYRSFGSEIVPLEPLIEGSTYTIWDFKYAQINCFMIGGFGSWRTDGQDVIRLTDQMGYTINNQTGSYGGGYYTFNKDCFGGSNIRVLFSAPEMFGGGEKGVMPIFPYLKYDMGMKMSIYGAPDGFNDGVIITLASSGRE